MVQDVFQPLKQKLRQCIPEKTAQIKIVLSVEPQGAIASLTVNPDTAEDCVKTHLKDQTFPATKKQTNEQIVYLVKR